MSQEVKKKISATEARSRIKTSKTDSSFGISNKVVLVIVLVAWLFSWAYQTFVPQPPKILGTPDGPPIDSPRIRLRDGRHIAYEEMGVPKHVAKSKIIFIHGFDGSKYIHPFSTVSPAVVEELGVYIVALDRPGYGESDPDPKRTVKSLAFDIEEFADELNLGTKFYVAGWSIGGMVTWSCLKYIPHRLAGAILIAPAINYWWPNFPSNLANEAYLRQLKQDQWSLRVAHYVPWLTYWWNTQNWFPFFSVIDGGIACLSRPDLEVLSNLFAVMGPNKMQAMKSHARQQGEFESLHRDLNIGFGKWEFDPMDLEINPLPNNNGTIHIWNGDEDLLVPVTLQRYIAQQLGWVKYHEVTGAGHLMVYTDGIVDNILKALLN